MTLQFQTYGINGCADSGNKECPHFLGSLEPAEEVTVFGCGCSSSKENGFVVTVAGCDLYGKCVTFTRGTHTSDRAIKRCIECESNPNRNKPPGQVVIDPSVPNAAAKQNFQAALAAAVKREGVPGRQ